ncbi:tetratricopeptide repeat protein [Mucilaginibacter sp. HMF5004]|uniref:tetratricopeptide repeat protein n=1 Tax=Mucilaginibacter rivuli TaxID=2857527 RepID=UPI001C5FA0C9|nr:tetratricopeptide repeat protein [Mucilaginibacter rivuli]MBW4888687.1 tetratricopeptide repeat protein [Mucilaginibacter rivuli]
MNRAIIISLLGISISLSASAQKKKADEVNKTAAIVGKSMSAMDSNAVTQLFFSALREKTVENTTLAAEMFNRILQMDPQNDASMYELGKIRRTQNNETSARDLFEKAVAVKPDNEYYWLALANSYEKSNDIPKLENVFTQLIRLSPDNPEYKFDKANALYLEKKYDEALALYNELQQSSGLNDAILVSKQKIYLKQGKVTEAAAELENMIKANPSQLRYSLLLSELYNSNGMSDKALAILLKAEKINPDNDHVHLALADIYRDKKDYLASFNELKLAFAIPNLSIEQKLNIIRGYIPKFPDVNAKESALELSRILTVTHPNDARTYAMYGNMLLETEQYPEAKKVFKKAVKLNDQDYSVWEQLVRLELGGETDEAIKDANEALSIFPNQAWLNYLAGIAWIQKKDYNKALGYMNNVPALETQDKNLLSQTYSAIGDCYHSIKDFKKSDEAYDKSIEYNPDNVYTLNNYAYYLSLRGEALDKAAQMSKHSNDLDKNNASFEDTYAWILFRQKKYAEAKTWIEKAIANSKNKSAIATEHYGDILFFLGKADDALDNWKKAKQLGGSSAELDRKINEKKYVE